MNYFDDPDKDMLEYKVGNKLPSWILMDAKIGFATVLDVGSDGSDSLRFEVLDKQLLEEDRKIHGYFICC